MIQPMARAVEWQWKTTTEWPAGTTTPRSTESTAPTWAGRPLAVTLQLGW